MFSLLKVGWTKMETYQEKINRYVVEYHIEFSDGHKAEMRLNGIDPDQHWILKWSFENELDANKRKDKDQQWYIDFCRKNGYEPQKTYRVRDLGETKYIERSVLL